MTVVSAIVEEDDEAAERDRIAWNLPRRPLMEVPRIVPALDSDRLDDDIAALEGLDWQGFLSRYFPGRRRHDLEALVAYGAYRRSEDSHPSAPEASAVDVWADDGGTTR